MLNDKFESVPEFILVHMGDIFNHIQKKENHIQKNENLKLN